MEQIMSAISRVSNSNAAMHAILAGAFTALAVRSVFQKRVVEELEAERDLLLKTNKDLKKTMWDWKQRLYEEAEANLQEALVPISTLKAIYGDVAPTSPVLSGGDDKQEGRSSASKIMI